MFLIIIIIIVGDIDIDICMYVCTICGHVKSREIFFPMSGQFYYNVGQLGAKRGEKRKSIRDQQIYILTNMFVLLSDGDRNGRRVSGQKAAREMIGEKSLSLKFWEPGSSSGHGVGPELFSGSNRPYPTHKNQSKNLHTPALKRRRRKENMKEHKFKKVARLASFSNGLFLQDQERKEGSRCPVLCCS